MAALALKPPTQPKSKRLKKKKMTIAAGFFFKDGILLCADREESSGASTKSVSKIFNLNSNEWTIVGASAGSAPAADLTIKRLRWEFVKTFALAMGGMRLLESPEENLENAIVKVLTKIHEDHIWHNPKADHRMRLIIAINSFKHKQQYLYLTEDNIPQPIETYCCMGYGEDLCTYFCRAPLPPRFEKGRDAVVSIVHFSRNKRLSSVLR